MRTIDSKWIIMAVFALGIGHPYAQTKGSKGKARVIKIDTIKVEGRIQKPEAFYILQRSQLNFEGLEPKKSFLPLIIKSVDKEPF